MTLPRLTAVSVVLALASCAVEVPDVEIKNISGVWNLVVENGPNGCGFERWNAGERLGDVGRILIHQAPRNQNLQVEIDGLLGIAIEIGYGARMLQGSIKEQDVRLELFNTRPTKGPGACVSTMNLVVTARAEKNRLVDGQIAYTPKTNGSPDCGVLNMCQTLQFFDSTRLQDVPDAGAPVDAR